MISVLFARLKEHAVTKRMWTQLVWGLVTGWCVLVAAPVRATDEGQEAANQVSATIYDSYLNLYLFTHTGHNRGMNGAQHDPCRDNIKALFESYGLPTVFETFTYSGQTWENVVAQQTGTLYPDSIYIIGGHYDSVSNPGADDNASGVAGTLEAARILSQYPSDYTIRYIAFDMEEQGLIGSDHYATAHADEDIRGMISLDMICYEPTNPPTNACLIYGTSASNPIKSALGAAITEYSGGLTYTDEGGLDASDHAPFEWQGFQACLIIEGAVWSNPYYHTQNDKYESPNYLNFPYAAKMVRSVVGWLVDAAGVNVPVEKLDFAYPQGLPEYALPGGNTTIRVEVVGVGGKIPQPGTGLLHVQAGSTWQEVAMTEVTDNVYDAHLPVATCGGPMHYYFSAQSTDGQTYVDPYNAPTDSFSATVAYGRDTFYQNDLSSNPGWTVQGLWAFGHPIGGGGQHGGHDPSNGYTGTNVYGYNLNGDYENNLPERHLTSTAISCAGKYGVHLKFRRWLGVEQPSFDHAYVRVSNNGITFTTVWENSGEVADTSWHEMDLDVSAVADNKPSVLLRWTMGPTDTAWQYCGWNIEDVQLTSLVCQSPWLPGDLNCDGAVNFGDINPFVQVLTDLAGWEQAHPNCPLLTGDINGDGAVNFGDINPFVALLSGK
jgi:hypothetical protein